MNRKSLFVLIAEDNLINALTSKMKMMLFLGFIIHLAAQKSGYWCN